MTYDVLLIIDRSDGRMVGRLLRKFEMNALTAQMAIKIMHFFCGTHCLPVMHSFRAENKRIEIRNF